MTQNNFKFYKPNDIYGTLFFQFPKVLIYGEQYNKLSSDAKIAYMLLKDKLEFSIKNEWKALDIIISWGKRSTTSSVISIYRHGRQTINY